MYVVTIRTTVEYGCEAWTTTRQAERKLRTFENKICTALSMMKQKIIEDEDIRRNCTIWLMWRRQPVLLKDNDYKGLHVMRKDAGRVIQSLQYSNGKHTEGYPSGTTQENMNRSRRGLTEYGNKYVQRNDAL